MERLEPTQVPHRHDLAFAEGTQRARVAQELVRRAGAWRTNRCYRQAAV
jgi:hypothetical protein